MDNFNFTSREWMIIRDRLNEDLGKEVEKLCKPGCTHDEANLIRGRILYIKEFLLHERTAARKVHQEAGPF